MATKLDKELIRESTVKYDDREIVMTLSTDQEIKFKLKGMKSGEVKISIEALYKQLIGFKEVNDDEEVTPIEPKVNKSLSIVNEEKVDKKRLLIDLDDLRSLNVVTAMDLQTKIKFDGIIVELIENEKEKRKILKK